MSNIANQLRELVHHTHNYVDHLKCLGMEFIPDQSLMSATSAAMTDVNTSLTPTAKETLLALREEVVTCTRCQELASTRQHVVFGAGNARAKLCFVGEAPGHEEDVQGLPFVGRAGELLTKIIAAIGLRREDVFICNVLKCRPPGNRTPLPEEVLNCEPYLKAQLAIIKPQVICALGKVAAQALLKTGEPISKLRGKQFQYEGITVVPTFHPAYLLRNPQDKRKVWEDMKLISKLLLSRH